MDRHKNEMGICLSESDYNSQSSLKSQESEEEMIQVDVNKPPQMSHFNFQGKDAKEFDLNMNPITEESPD